MSAGSVWGITFVLARIATEKGAHPVGLAVWQALLCFVFLFVILKMRGRSLPLTSKHLTFYAVCGFFGTALPNALYFYAARHVSAGVLAITLASTPMLTMMIAAPLGLERATISRAFGLLLGISGIALLVLPEASLPNRAAAVWVLGAVLCALCYAIENVIIDLKMPEDCDPLTVLCGMMAMGFLMLIVVAFFMDAFFIPSYPPTAVEYALVVMALVNAIAYSTFIYLIGKAGPVFASQMAYVVTLSGVAWGLIIFNEQHSPWVWAALVTMLTGLVLVRPREQ